MKLTTGIMTLFVLLIASTSSQSLTFTSSQSLTFDNLCLEGAYSSYYDGTYDYATTISVDGSNAIVWKNPINDYYLYPYDFGNTVSWRIGRNYTSPSAHLDCSSAIPTSDGWYAILDYPCNNWMEFNGTRWEKNPSIYINQGACPSETSMEPSTPFPTYNKFYTPSPVRSPYYTNSPTIVVPQSVSVESDNSSTIGSVIGVFILIMIISCIIYSCRRRSRLPRRYRRGLLQPQPAQPPKVIVQNAQMQYVQVSQMQPQQQQIQPQMIYVAPQPQIQQLPPAQGQQIIYTTGQQPMVQPVVYSQPISQPMPQPMPQSNIPGIPQPNAPPISQQPMVSVQNEAVKDYGDEGSNIADANSTSSYQ